MSAATDFPQLQKNILEGNNKTLFNLLKISMAFQLRAPSNDVAINTDGWVVDSTTGNKFLSV